MNAKKPRLLNVQAGRGAAALLVVAYHANAYYFGTAEYWRTPALHHFFAWGSAGVQFFFVLSGFIITTAHWDDLGKPNRVLAFARRRFTRLYPFYWICLAGALVLFATVHTTIRDDRLTVLTSTVLIGPQPTNTVIFPAWSLYYEIAFYVLAGMAIWKPRFGLVLLTFWLTWCFIDGFVDPTAFYLIAPVNVLFPLGAGCALLLRNRSMPKPWILLGVGAALFVGTGVYETYETTLPTMLTLAGFGLGTGLLLLGSVELERSHRWQAPRWAIITGEASYSIYLTHMLVLAASAKIARHFGLTKVPPSIAIFGLVIAAAIGGIAIHYLIETPAINWTRGRLSGRAPPVSPRLAQPQ